MLEGFVGPERIGVAIPNDTPLFEDVVPIGDAQEGVEIFINKQDRESGGLELLEAGPDFGADERGETLGGLVKDEQAGVGHEGASNGEHLLLSSGKLVAHVLHPLGQSRKE